MGKSVKRCRTNTEHRDRGLIHLPFLGGVVFSFAIAYAGMGLAKLPGINRVGSMIAAILLAVLYRQAAGYPESLKSGIQFTAKVLLRVAIVLFGFRLDLAIVLSEGLGLLLRDLGTVVGALFLVIVLAKWFKADQEISLLLGVGTGVCGAAAIAAVSPIVKSREEDTAVSVGLLALTGTVFTIAYTLLRPILPLSSEQYAIWSGVSLHEIAHVAAAASPAGQDAMAVALLAKLGRVLLLVPLSLALVYWMGRRGAGSTMKDPKGHARVEFPWFLVGFMLTSLIGSYTSVSDIWMGRLASTSSFLLTAAMVSLGLNVSFGAIKEKAFRPLMAMLIASVILSLVTYLTIA